MSVSGIEYVTTRQRNDVIRLKFFRYNIIILYLSVKSIKQFYYAVGSRTHKTIIYLYCIRTRLRTTAAKMNSKCVAAI